MYFHGMSLYSEVLHVPLMFRVPKVKPAMRDDVVELIDMAPTIAALFGVTPPASWIGRSAWSPRSRAGRWRRCRRFSECCR